MNNCFQWYECRLDLVVYNTTLTYKERLQQAHSLIQWCQRKWKVSKYRCI